MSGGFTAVDLSELPAPKVVEEVAFEVILVEMLEDLKQRDPAFSALLESDPAYKVLQVAAFREVMLRQRVNDAAKAVMLAYATKADLDHLGALFRVERLLLAPAQPDALPPVEAVYEADEDYRRRIQLSLEGYSTAGSEGAYIFHSLAADGDVLDASVDAPRFSKAVLSQAVQDQLPEGVVCYKVDYDAGLAEPRPGDVVVSVLGRGGDGAAGADLLGAVSGILSSEKVRPVTDRVHVRSAQIINYAVDATLYFDSGPDRAVVLQEAENQLNKYIAAQHRLGRDVTVSGVYSALHQPGVASVDLRSPAAGVPVGVQSAAFCNSVSLVDGGVYD